MLNLHNTYTVLYVSKKNLLSHHVAYSKMSIASLMFEKWNLWMKKINIFKIKDASESESQRAFKTHLTNLTSRGQNWPYNIIGGHWEDRKPGLNVNIVSLYIYATSQDTAVACFRQAPDYSYIEANRSN